MGRNKVGLPGAGELQKSHPKKLACCLFAHMNGQYMMSVLKGRKVTDISKSHAKCLF